MMKISKKPFNYMQKARKRLKILKPMDLIILLIKLKRIVLL
jgi:hypothetical protein